MKRVTIEVNGIVQVLVDEKKNPDVQEEAIRQWYEMDFGPLENIDCVVRSITDE